MRWENRKAAVAAESAVQQSMSKKQIDKKILSKKVSIFSEYERGAMNLLAS